MAHKIAVIEDDVLISKVLVNFLAAAGYDVVTAFDGQTGLALVLGEKVDLILLDIMLPELDGLTVLEKIRQKKTQVPVIMLTALEDEITQLASFNQWADDYVTKPFSPSILLKRVEAILRRTTQGTRQPKIMVYGNITVNLEACKVTLDNQLVILTKKEYEIVCYFLENKGQVLQREQMLNALWDFAANVDDRIIDTHIKNIRKKLPTFEITTVKGMGYLLEG